MLVEIRCDAFRIHGKDGEIRPPIRFHEGLNTVLGGAEADNSIGKSTFLMIIDYCFGGETYAKMDVKNYVGDHTICFAFQFEDGMHYFSRSVSSPNVVNVCDENYTVQSSMKIADYKAWLLEAYGMSHLRGATFRDLVSRFFRVSGKGNDNCENPLHNGSPKAADAITSLEKLFDLYKFVDDLKAKLKEANDKKETYNKARRLQLIPNAVKSQKKYDENEQQIAALEAERDSLTQETDQELLQKELERKDMAAQVEVQLRGLKRQYSSLSSRYRVVTKNRDDQFISTEDDLQRLLTFFPGANIRHIQEVEDFHRELSGILSMEMDEEAESLQILIRAATEEIQRLEQQLAELGVPLQIPKPFLDRYSELNKQIGGMRAQNEAYIKTNELKEEVKEIETRLDEAEMQVLHQIEASLNAQMVRYNDSLYEVPREAPTIRFESKTKYVFETPRDGGKGTAYKSLCVLDLSVMKLTLLPFIAHDSSIFKNIGDEPIDKLMEIYLQSKKQIFIAFDKDKSYRDRTAEIVNSTTVLKLNINGEELFGWCWATKEASEDKTESSV